MICALFVETVVICCFAIDAKGNVQLRLVFLVVTGTVIFPKYDPERKVCDAQCQCGGS